MNIAIDRLAALTRLSLNEKEKKRIEIDLTDILAYVDQLREVSADNVEEITRAAPEINMLRADAISEKEEDDMETAALLRGAFPEHVAGYIRVPLVINKRSK